MAVIEALDLARLVPVGWSYGGYIISDYVRAHGEGAVAGLNYVAGTTVLNESLDNIGPGFIDNAEGVSAPDLPTNISAMRSFVRTCTAEPMTPEVWRAMIFSRRMDFDDVLSKMSVPVLVTHGDQDTVVLPSIAQHVLDVCPTAEASWYQGIGHAPFLENAERFNRELADPIRRVSV